MQDLMKPTFYPGGSSAKELTSRYRAAMGALDEAYETLAQVRPHRRDYCVKANAEGDFDIAAEQHRSRESKIVEVREEMLELMLFAHRNDWRGRT